MIALLDIASPVEVAALLRLDLLSADDIAALCMRWLEEDVDAGDPGIAALAGRSDLSLWEARPILERFLKSRTPASTTYDEAILAALHLHLAAALRQDDLLEGVRCVLSRFVSLSDRRLVRNPRRARDHPEGEYAQENLGLEYIYGGFHAFDDIQHLPPHEGAAAAAALEHQLREDVRELRDHLAALTLQASH